MLDTVSAWRQTLTTRMVTTLLCCGWGYSFFCSFFRCLLVRPNLYVGIAAALPLGIVWAALERKRWGRLALLFLSLLALSLFLLMFFALLCSEQSAIEAGGQGVMLCFKRTLGLFAEEPAMSFLILMLAGVTTAWFTLPAVRAEYETGKNKIISLGQPVIAVTLITVWSVSMILNPPVFDINHPSRIVKAGRSLTHRF